MIFYILMVFTGILFIKTYINAPDITSDAYSTYIMMLHFYMGYFIVLVSASVIYDKIKELIDV